MGWHYLIGDVEHGPISDQQLRSLARAGEINQFTQVRRTTHAMWSIAGEVKGLFEIPSPPALPELDPVVAQSVAEAGPAGRFSLADFQRELKEISKGEHVIGLASTASFESFFLLTSVGLAGCGLGCVVGFLAAANGSEGSGFVTIGMSVGSALVILAVMAGIAIVRDHIRLTAAIAIELRLIRKRLHAPAAAETNQNTPPPESTNPSLR